MKKIALTLSLILFAGFLSFSQTSNVPGYDKLPQKAKKFITTNFANDPVTYVDIDKDMGKEIDYEVKLQSGTEINFDAKGEWDEIDGKQMSLPTSVIPEGILQYVNTHYKGQTIVKIDKDWNGYDVELNNDIDLKFDKNSKFLKIDH